MFVYLHTQNVIYLNMHTTPAKKLCFNSTSISHALSRVTIIRGRHLVARALPSQLAWPSWMLSTSTKS